jgi:hypothetical protein
LIYTLLIKNKLFKRKSHNNTVLLVNNNFF